MPGMLIAQLSWIRPIAFGLYLRPTPLEGDHNWYCKQGQKCGWGDHSAKWKETYVVLLDGCQPALSTFVFMPVDHIVVSLNSSNS